MYVVSSLKQIIFSASLLALAFGITGQAEAARSYSHPPFLFYETFSVWGNDSPVIQLMPGLNNQGYNGYCNTDPSGNPALSIWPIGAGGPSGFDLPTISGVVRSPTMKECGKGWQGGRTLGHVGQLVITNESSTTQPVKIRLFSVGSSFVPIVKLKEGLQDSNLPETFTSTIFSFCIAQPRSTPVYSITTNALKMGKAVATPGAAFSGNTQFETDIAAGETFGCLIGQTFTPAAGQELTGTGRAFFDLTGGYKIKVDIDSNLGGVTSRLTTNFDHEYSIGWDSDFSPYQKFYEFLNGGRLF